MDREGGKHFKTKRFPLLFLCQKGDERLTVYFITDLYCAVYLIVICFDVGWPHPGGLTVQSLNRKVVKSLPLLVAGDSGDKKCGI